VRVTVIATGFDRAGVMPALPAFDRERELEREPRADTQSRRPPVFDESQRSSLEISEDEIDVPPFLKDT
jgi:cell division protein FtsZ